MLKKKYIVIVVLFISLFMASNFLAQEVISSGELSITIEKSGHGVKLLSIKKEDTELLDTKVSSIFFTMTVDKTFLTPLSGWDSVAVSNTGSECSIIFAKPTSSKMPKTLVVTVTINTSGNKADWDMSVTGLGSSSLQEVDFPYLNILAKGNDYALIPKHSGQLIKNPKSSGVNETLEYLRWAATMQFCAYYNDNYGIYFGTHDPKASIKEFIVKANVKDGVKFETKIPIPNKILSGNDWEYSGKFRLELFEGNWYEAAMIYRKWASAEAEYWPKDTPESIARREAAGNVALWMLMLDQKNSISQLRGWMTKFANYMGVPVGIHWYSWNDIQFDENYPYFFPAKSGMKGLVNELQQNGNITIMPYINGRLYDQDLPNYLTEGKVWAVKDKDGKEETQPYGGISAVECPTQSGYQDIIVDACKQITDSIQIGCDAIYIDQVAYSKGLECFDKDHGHETGGGTAWRSGYNEMFEKAHRGTAKEKFFTSEGNCDFIADEVDIFLAQRWTIDNLVPAFQAVYSGKLQYFGTKAGWRPNINYYCQYANSFVNGVQPGRFYVSTVDLETGPYVRRMGRMRNKLKEYLSFGRMLKPIEIDKSGIENITSNWESNSVTISALQSSLWRNRDEDKAMILFANASKTKTLNFTLDFDGSTRGLSGKLRLQKVTEDSDGDIITKENSFSMNISLKPLDIVAYIIEPDSMATSLDKQSIINNYKLEQNYPNPFNPSTVISFTIPKSGLTKLSVFNILGQEVAVLVNKEMLSGNYEYEFDASNLSSGIYFYRLQSNKFTSIKKMMLIK